jgi:uncharacterized tellurite resistance protein B-like protein
MDEREREIVKSLMQIAWADGRWTPDEEALVGLILARIGLTPGETEQMKSQYSDPNKLAELERYIPDKPKRLNAMRLLLAVAYADLDVPDEEAAYLAKMAAKLDISPQELEDLMQETIRRDNR